MLKGMYGDPAFANGVPRPRRHEHSGPRQDRSTNSRESENEEDGTAEQCGKKLRARRRRALVAFVSPLLALLGLYVFSAAFFLAKRSLPHVSECSPLAAKELLCGELGLSAEEVEGLRRDGILAQWDDGSDSGLTSDGCLLPREVDAIAIIVVDALRFDFAAERLPKSIGSRLHPESDAGSSDTANAARLGRSALYKFVADPPTVTMQRIKGLTTGGLPTFADISGSFGGAYVEEDSWVAQLRSVSPAFRGYAISENRKGEVTRRKGKPLSGFVGDDTWIDLFPNEFHDAHPYPSFNTRDLDTVDNGVLGHLPRMLRSFGTTPISGQSTGRETQEDGEGTFFEVVVAHFLGVDHAGHTYGPDNPHMYEKLQQIDDALASVLDRIDSPSRGGSPAAESDSMPCRAALVFGDHGMTEDGNHGGGTTEEINAALFAHFGPGCGFSKVESNGEADGGIMSSGASSLSETGEAGDRAARAYESVHQVDLVPTLSILLGLPIPFANLGGVIPGLLPPRSRDTNIGASGASTATAAAALALNAAQVWRYLSTYSQDAQSLPKGDMEDLRGSLDDAASAYREALRLPRGSEEERNKWLGDSTAYRRAAGLFKAFLTESTQLGKRVWTRFDARGMWVGGMLLWIAVLASVPTSPIAAFREFIGVTKVHKAGVPKEDAANNLDGIRRAETMAACVLAAFQTVVLTFSNSYIEAEQGITMLSLAVLSCLVAFRRYAEGARGATRGINRFAWLAPLAVPLCSRLHELFVKGHGLDPSLRVHFAHRLPVFLFSVLVLIVFRLGTNRSKRNIDIILTMMDSTALIFLGYSWNEKRSSDRTRNGYGSSRVALVLSVLGFFIAANGIRSVPMQSTSGRGKRAKEDRTTADASQRIRALLYEVMLFIATVTGPSAASSFVFLLVQLSILSSFTTQGEEGSVSPFVGAIFWRLAIRHNFYSTGHACGFNRLQFSAAFATTEVFNFYLGGVSLFLNTFGWDIVGMVLLLLTSSSGACKGEGINSRKSLWEWFCFVQLLETAFACVSVSLMRRHLMVWAIFAPRFLFSAVFTTLSLCLWLTVLAIERSTK